MADKTTISEHHLQEAVRSLFSNHRYVLVNSYVFNWESDLFSVTKTGTVYEVEIKISKADYKKDFEKDKHLLFQSHMAKKTHHIFRHSDRYVWDRSRLIATYTDPRLNWQHAKGYSRDYKNGGWITGYGTAYFDPREKEVMAQCTGIEIKPIEETFCPNRFYYASPPGIIEEKDLPKYAGLIHVKDGHAYQVKQAPFLHKRPLLEAKLLHILLDKFWYLSQRQRYKLLYNDIKFDEAEHAEKENTI